MSGLLTATPVATEGLPHCPAKGKHRDLHEAYRQLLRYREDLKNPPLLTWLDLAHRRLDATVSAAYGWPEDQTDHQLLEKLLALNFERAAAEKQKPV